MYLILHIFSSYFNNMETTYTTKFFYKKLDFTGVNLIFFHLKCSVHISWSISELYIKHLEYCVVFHGVWVAVFWTLIFIYISWYLQITRSTFFKENSYANSL